MDFPGIGDRILLAVANPEGSPIPARDADRDSAHNPSLKRGFLALQ
jgi:hypothetical protein